MALAGLAVGVPVAVLGIGWVLRARLRTRLRTVAADAGRAAADTWPGVVGLSVVALAGYVATFVVAARAAGSSASVPELLPLLVLALLVMSLPINVGLGAAGGGGGRRVRRGGARRRAGPRRRRRLRGAGLVACLPGGAVLVLRPRLTRARLTRSRLTRTRRTTAPGSPVGPVLVLPSRGTGDRPLPTPCTPQDPGSAGDGGRPRGGRPVRSAA